MFKFIFFVLGYVRIKVYGLSTERFLNLCSINGIITWNITPCDRELYLDIRTTDFFKIKKILRKTNTKAVIIKKCGLPFLVKRFSRKRLFFWGSIVFLISLYCLYSLVWNIKIIGNENISELEIRNFIYSNYQKVPILRKDLDCELLEKKLKSKFSEINWISVSCEGLSLIINITENAVGEENLSVDYGNNICTDVCGEITEIIVRSGISKVKSGDYVSAGDILVEGNINIYNDDATLKENYYVAPDADIRITYKQKWDYKLPYEHFENLKTGRKNNNKSLFVFNHIFSIPNFFIQDVKAKNKIEISEINSLYILNENIKLGDFVNKDEYEVQKTLLRYSPDEVKKILYENLDSYICSLSQKDIQIIKKSVKIDRCNDGVIISVDFLLNKKI